MSIFYRILFIFIFSFTILVFCKNMILIPNGVYYPLFKFDNEVYTPVDINSFYLDMYPVTNSDFKIFLDSFPSWEKNNIKSIFADKNYLSHWDGADYNDISDCPVVNISWFAANSYCRFFGKRLPCVNEWEYVANYEYSDYSRVKYLRDILVWYAEKNLSLLSVYKMNKDYLGLYGLRNGVWEWVNDFNSVIILNPDIEGGKLEEVLYCGAAASMSVNPSDYASFMRFAFRNSLEADYTMTNLGFRCAKDYN